MEREILPEERDELMLLRPLYAERPEFELERDTLLPEEREPAELLPESPERSEEDLLVVPPTVERLLLRIPEL